MDRRDRGRGKPKDAAMETLTTDEDAGKGHMEEDASSETRISTVEKELNDLNEDLSEIKALLKTLTEGKRVDEGLEEKESLKKEVEIEPKKEPDEGDDQSRGRQ